MKNCNKCGHLIDDNAIFCQNCGARVNGDRTGFTSYNPYYGQGTPVLDTKGSVLIAVVSFFWTYAGLLLWLFMRRTRPGKARSALKGMIAGISVSMPIAGATIWAIWSDEESNGEYAKIAAVSAIVGVIMYALLIVALFVTKGFSTLDLGSISIEHLINDANTAVACLI